jgi:hypothetical protein
MRGDLLLGDPVQAKPIHDDLPVVNEIVAA